jgi:hypothetical protein
MPHIDIENPKIEQETNNLNLGRMRAGALITSNQQSLGTLTEKEIARVIDFAIGIKAAQTT